MSEGYLATKYPNVEKTWDEWKNLWLDWMNEGRTEVFYHIIGDHSVYGGDYVCDAVKADKLIEYVEFEVD